MGRTESADVCTFTEEHGWSHDCECEACRAYNAALDSYLYPER